MERMTDDAYFVCRPVGLKEAALDSPTFRATSIHFSEQVDLIERWVEDYLKSTNRLVAESATLENAISSFTSYALLPSSITEAVLDHDYSVLAMRKYGEGAKDFWMSTMAVIKRLTALVVEPIRSFLQNDLRAFKVGPLSATLFCSLMVGRMYDGTWSRARSTSTLYRPSLPRKRRPRNHRHCARMLSSYTRLEKPI